MDLKYLGPPLNAGPLPAVFYFALSAQDSLHLDPYNQPAVFISSPRLRVFSMTLPAHDTMSPVQAMENWRAEIEKGNDIITPFVEAVAEKMEKLVSQGAVVRDKVATMGLSRGAFIASLIAAKTSLVKYILGFAPVTQFSHLSLLKFVDQLCDRTLRFYIGNRDTLVGTDHCFQFIHTLANAAYARGIRTSPIEMIITPSVGQHGHGTLPPVFRNGTD